MRTFDPREAAALFGSGSWFKANTSNDNGTGCVEVSFAPHARFSEDGWCRSTATSHSGTGCVEGNFSPVGWFKATASDDNGTGCVEVNFASAGLVGLRDSKHPQGPAFAFTPTEWRAFLTFCIR